VVSVDVLAGVIETGTSGADGPEDPPPQETSVSVTIKSAIRRKQVLIERRHRTALLSNCIVPPPFDSFDLTVLGPVEKL
jgi:hypothetical protein